MNITTRPANYRTLSLFEIADKNKAQFNDGDWIEAQYIVDQGIRLVQTGNIGNGFFISREKHKKFISEETFNQLKCKELKYGDILICRLAEPAGRACIYTENEKSIASVDITIFRPNPEKYNLRYLVYLMSSNAWFLKILENVGGTTHKRISRSNLGKQILKVVPLAEQQKIAQSLTDADNYISALEKLIEKKKMIKEGLMVNLLTGKQRLKEFAFNEDGTAKGYKESELGKIPADWEIGNLGNLTTLKARIGWQGLTVAEYLDQGDYYLVTGTDFNEGFIDFDHCPYVDKSRYSQDPNIQLKNNDVLVTKDGTIGKVAYIENLDLPATLNSGVFVVRPIGSGINSKFLYYILMSKYFDDFLKKITAGSTITHLYQKDFVHFDFVLPTLDEQNSIVSCLSNMDHDLMILEGKLNKANNIKQGMMQKLLTGEIRLA
ncbi:hypothetical protein F951_00661 [Acinetobacter soli CIP 110264]|uniref:restriction endonuclease subunit S n=1 Tax=Acinetobacter soli TaxID=487316 RepID=UPI0002CF73CC|nr:restriction endonuclease subunit S [Acinetobacter soli]ENV58332.1 hypothetical protein F951_00661 [Acinetobacter soli CIP 110264]